MNATLRLSLAAIAVGLTQIVLVPHFDATGQAYAAQGGLQGEAIAWASRYWDQHLSKCGDSYAAREFRFGSITQVMGGRFGVLPDALSPADRLNGIEWHGTGFVAADAQRHGDTWGQQMEWAPWISPAPGGPDERGRGPNDERFWVFRLRLSKVKGSWQIDGGNKFLVQTDCSALPPNDFVGRRNRTAAPAAEPRRGAEGPVAAPRPIAASMAANNRIQTRRWVDLTNTIDDPLNEIVEVIYLKDPKFMGTGTFLKDCRVVTALHVLLSMIHGQNTKYLSSPNESLIGEKFNFRTNPVLYNGRIQRVTGSFVVLGHGKPLSETTFQNAEEDWVVGYDEQCVSDKLALGHVIPINGQKLEYMEARGDGYFTAGHSIIPAATNKNGEYELYIDSKCSVTNKEHISDAYVLTTCSYGPGGSGQLLMTPAKKKGVIQIGPGGHPLKLAHGIFQGMELNIDVGTPNVKGASGVAPFTYDLWNKMAPFLEGPVDTEKLGQIAFARHQRR